MPITITILDDLFLQKSSKLCKVLFRFVDPVKLSNPQLFYHPSAPVYVQSRYFGCRCFHPVFNLLLFEFMVMTTHFCLKRLFHHDHSSAVDPRFLLSSSGSHMRTVRGSLWCSILRTCLTMSISGFPLARLLIVKRFFFLTWFAFLKYLIAGGLSFVICFYYLIYFFIHSTTVLDVQTSRRKQTWKNPERQGNDEPNKAAVFNTLNNISVQLAV